MALLASRSFSKGTRRLPWTSNVSLELRGLSGPHSQSGLGGQSSVLESCHSETVVDPLAVS